MASSHEHIVKSFDNELARIKADIVQMGELALRQLAAAMDALRRRDVAAAERVIAADEQIDALEHRVSTEVLEVLALRQPMARDLREVYAALRIASDIERVGDYAANVAKRSRKLGTLDVAALPGLEAVAQLAGELFQAALDSYRERDTAAAEAVRARDEDLDRRHTAVIRELLGLMSADPTLVNDGTHLLFITKNLERIGDHATNIAENTWFLVHGELPGSRRR